MTIEEIKEELNKAQEETEDISAANNAIVIFTQGYCSGLNYALELLEECEQQDD